ncbi:MAG: hypothetical protein FWG11_05585 [Promicromonosporaceae bacterium]|nr:hypothetical protein [Promicromonosporaceae bacterium]
MSTATLSRSTSAPTAQAPAANPLLARLPLLQALLTLGSLIAGFLTVATASMGGQVLDTSTWQDSAVIGEIANRPVIIALAAIALLLTGLAIARKQAGLVVASAVFATLSGLYGLLAVFTLETPDIPGLEISTGLGAILVAVFGGLSLLTGLLLLGLRKRANL